MARQFAIDDTAQPSARLADAFVILSVTVLSLACGAWFLQQLGFGLWAAVVAALTVYSVLLGVHLALRRSILFEVERPAETWVRSAYARAEASPAPVGADGDASFAGQPPGSPEEEARRWAKATTVADERAQPDDLPMPRGPGAFHFRPSREPSLAPATAGTSVGPFAGSRPDAMPTPEPEASAPEMSVELIQDLIKKLADELNSTTTGEPGSAPESALARDVAIADPAAPPSSIERTMPAPAAVAPREALARASTWPRVEPAPQGEAGIRAPDAPPALNPQLARIAEAVAAERMEVLLEPIHALAEGRPRHFEVSVRLLTADGASLDQREFSRATRGTGLMPRIDAARMVRAARVARRLGDRGRKGSVLTTMDGQSLTDDSFLAVASEAGVHADMGLVLSFAQNEVRNFSPAHANALRALAAGGLRFALEDVTDLDMDFAALQEMGIEFVKLDAPVFLDGLPMAGGRIPAADICRHLADFGLTLIVGRIEDDWLLARILGFGVLFGKGALFGEPRLVKDEMVAGPA
jgi:cyclic-di-GMP phosphodiesterase, flagellum assembly factor TipF